VAALSARGVRAAAYAHRSGKTLAAFGGALLEALSDSRRIRTGIAKKPARKTSPRALKVLWITPLKALATDTVRALREPVAALGLDWQVGLRTGDASARDKRLARDGRLDVLVHHAGVAVAAAVLSGHRAAAVGPALRGGRRMARAAGQQARRIAAAEPGAAAGTVPAAAHVGPVGDAGQPGRGARRAAAACARQCAGRRRRGAQAHAGNADAGPGRALSHGRDTWAFPSFRG
jgi:hypothetical protein